MPYVLTAAVTVAMADVAVLMCYPILCAYAGAWINPLTLAFPRPC